jgi:D-beta-D-heptose 7-phosphate kinase/D-beta-D-heptose 1-phosphate adenosyltransferase
MDELISLIDRWKRHKVVVVGDFMLDHYVYGDAERLSPDAPVPVLAIKREEYNPGGASNVCMQLAALKCRVHCLGVVGKDGSADHLRGRLRRIGCDVSGLVVSSDRPTTVKHNFIGLAQHRHPQKMFRVDDERRDPIPPDVTRRLVAKARSALRGAAVLCIEDYNKGVLTSRTCQQLIKLARSMKVPVMVDPAAIRDYTPYAGATCITPNRTEAALATGHRGDLNGDGSALSAVSSVLLEKLRLEAVVLTLDKQGAMLQVRGQRPQIVPTRARQVYDVSGAGDVVLAMLAASRANGAGWRSAVQLANVAAGLEVERFGIVPIELDEILLSLLRQKHERLGKIRTLDQLLPELEAYRKQGKRIAFTNGCFDILHAGHVGYLRSARRFADLLVVGLNSDGSIRRIKGPRRPVNKQDDRVMVLSELESVDYIILFDQGTPVKLLRAIRPDVLVKGGDYRENQVVGREIVKSYGGQVKLVPLVQGRSTTNIIRKIASKNR